MIRKIEISDYSSIYMLGRELDKDYEKKNNLDLLLQEDYNHFFVVEEERKIVAFVQLTKSFDEADIVDIIVDKKYRRQNIATSLLDYAKNELQIIKFNLEVRKSNESAILFYEKYGFKVVRTIKNYYENEDALFMIKE